MGKEADKKHAIERQGAQARKSIIDRHKSLVGGTRLGIIRAKFSPSNQKLSNICTLQQRISKMSKDSKATRTKLVAESSSWDPQFVDEYKTALEKFISDEDRNAFSESHKMLGKRKRGAVEVEDNEAPTPDINPSLTIGDKLEDYDDASIIKEFLRRRKEYPQEFNGELQKIAAESLGFVF